MRTIILSLTRRFPWLAIIGALCLVAFGLTAKEAPKLNVTDRDIDRSVRGASYSSVIKRVAPSVVTIQSTRTISSRWQNPWAPFFNDPFFRQFFGDRLGRDGGRSRKFTEQILGSGVIVTEDGYILTNNHVVDGADSDGVKVALSDRKTKYDAKVVGRDPRTDVAVLKIDAKHLPAITIADSDKVEVGDVVLAIGNPFNVGQSVSMGIVSAVGRGVGIIQGGYEDFIQTDAAINPGNSGGALIDAEGRLIGINQSIVTGGAGANAGVGFAVPVNIAKTVLERISTGGKMLRGYLGIIPQDLDRGLAREFHVPDETGALVGDVMPGTPAEKAGIKRGAVITEVNGKTITDKRHLQLTIAQMEPGSKVTITLLRDGKEKTLTATLGELPEDATAKNDSSIGERGSDDTDPLDGVEVGDLDNETRRQMDAPREIHGAVVSRVDPDSAAYDAGLRENDVIVEINRQPVRDADEAVRLCRKGRGEAMLLRVWSNGGGGGVSGSHYLTVEPKKKK